MAATQTICVRSYDNATKKAEWGEFFDAKSKSAALAKARAWMKRQGFAEESRTELTFAEDGKPTHAMMWINVKDINPITEGVRP